MHPYIKQVKKSLNISHKTKAEILRDLEEAFASAAEHGETEQQVMDRLGTPEEFGESIQEQLGLSCTEKSSWKGRTGIAIAAFIFIIAFAGAWGIHASKPAKNMIGQADAATTIQIAGSGMDLFFWLLLIGGVGCITAIRFLLIMFIRINEIQKETRMHYRKYLPLQFYPLCWSVCIFQDARFRKSAGMPLIISNGMQPVWSQST